MSEPIKFKHSRYLHGYSSQYDPIVLVDQNNGEFVALTKYEAGNVRVLLEALQEARVSGVNTGDWFTDLQERIPKDWPGNLTKDNMVIAIKRG